MTWEDKTTRADRMNRMSITDKITIALLLLLPLYIIIRALTTTYAF